MTKNPNLNISVGKYLLDRLHSHGVKHIFGIPGDYILKFDKLIEKHESITFIGATRENTAGYMADAYARNLGLGVACITYGVGINIVNSMAQALVESVPLVIISGAAGINEFIKSSQLHHLINSSHTKNHDSSQLEIFKKVSIAQAVLHDSKTAPAEIDRVLDLCLEYKKPVYIEIPRNIVDQPIEKDYKYIPIKKHSSNPETLKQAIIQTSALLKECKQPVIWLGHEIDRLHLTDSFLKFAEKFHIPICSTLLGKSAISEQNPLFIGIYQGELSSDSVKKYVDSSDCIISLGTILSDVDTGIFTAIFNQRSQIFASQNGISINNTTLPNVDFRDYIEELAKLPCSTKFENKFSAAYSVKPEKFIPQKEKKITSKRVFECIGSHLKFGDVIVTDIGDSLFGSSDFVVDRGCFIACAYFASLGFGTPAAVATQLAKPSKRVIGIIGDGAFQMTCTELSTAVHYQINPIIIVLNNHGYGTERPLIEGDYNDVLDWDYSALTKVFKGGIGIEIRTEDQLDSALKTALNDTKNMYIIEIELDKLDFSPNLERFAKLVNKAKN